MPFTLLSLVDQVGKVMKNVSVITKVAAKKTSGVIGDDLALNAQQLNGIDPAKELPIVFAVARGSLINKVILVPIALIISAFFPYLVTPLLMIGGTFLCFEGVEKLLEKFFHKKDDSQNVSTEEKIKGAIKTDFILSAEIIVIALGTMSSEPIVYQVLALSIIGLVMNFGVYGFVALIIQIDDFGLALQKQTNKVCVKFGRFLIYSAPVLMKFLGIAGTTAMFLVGGGIISHGIHFISDFTNKMSEQLTSPFNMIVTITSEFVVGVIAGLIAVGFYEAYKKVRNK